VDGLSAALVAAAPQLGIGGILLALLVYVLRNASTDRGDYRAALADAQQRFAAELARINTDHDDEVAALRADVNDLRRRVDVLTAALDTERRRRWEAEDTAAALRRIDGSSG
jgi:Skp family chaperone for outer membrane proteins